jgi:hypothetical protein
MIGAPFAPIAHTLTIARAGTGQGTVSCDGGTCAASYAEGSEVTLKAIPAQGSTFTGWSGEECAGAGVVSIGKGAFGIADGVTQTFRIKLSAAALRELGKARSLEARAAGTGVLAGTVKLMLPWRRAGRPGQLTSDNTPVPKLSPIAERFAALLADFRPIWRRSFSLDAPNAR